MFTEEANKISLSANDDKTIKSIDSIEPNIYGSKRPVCKKEEIKFNTGIKQYKDD